MLSNDINLVVELIPQKQAKTNINNFNFNPQYIISSTAVSI